MHLGWLVLFTSWFSGNLSLFVMIWTVIDYCCFSAKNKYLLLLLQLVYLNFSAQTGNPVLHYNCLSPECSKKNWQKAQSFHFWCNRNKNNQEVVASDGAKLRATDVDVRHLTSIQSQQPMFSYVGRRLLEQHSISGVTQVNNQVVNHLEPTQPPASHQSDPLVTC